MRVGTRKQTDAARVFHFAHPIRSPTFVPRERVDKVRVWKYNEDFECGTLGHHNAAYGGCDTEHITLIALCAVVA